MHSERRQEARVGKEKRFIEICFLSMQTKSNSKQYASFIFCHSILVGVLRYFFEFLSTFMKALVVLKLYCVGFDAIDLVVRKLVNVIATE